MNMRKWTLITLLLAGAGAAQAYDDGDRQLWLKFFGDGKLADGFKVKFEESLYYGDDASEFYNQETYLLASYEAANWLSVGLGYRLVRELKTATVLTPKTADDGSVSYGKVGEGDHYWQAEERPTLELVAKQTLSGWGFEDQVRLEWRDKDDGKDDYLRFRNQIKVKTPWSFTALAINPYVAWEANYEDRDDLSGADRWNRHRYSAGVSAKLTKTLRAGLYYLRQDDRSGDDWRTYHVGGVDLGASF